MKHWLAKLHHIDRRWLYLAMALLLIIPFLVPISLPRGEASRTTQAAYDLLDSCPDDKVVLIDSSWDAGSRAENYAQLECVVRHLCSKGTKFVVTSVGVTPFAPEFADQVIRPIADKAGYVYGEDWVNAGYVQAGAGGLAVIINGLCRDFHEVFPADVDGTPMADLPLMSRVHTIEDIHVVYCVTYAPTPEWISFVKGQFGTPVVFGCMTIMAPTYYTFFETGQLQGIIIGNSGASEYEHLIGQPGKGDELIIPAAFANCLIILAAILGNVGLWASRASKEKANG